MNLILPVSGQSARYSGLRPKWMLTHPNGNLMLAESIRGLDLTNIESIVVICLKQHYDKYGVELMLKRQFAKLGLVDKLNIVVIEASYSQPYTVYQGLKLLNLSGPIFIKDSDNTFTYKPELGNRVCYARLSTSDITAAAAKSYIQVSEAGAVVNIIEKSVISDTFCAGGYLFADASQYITTFEKIETLEEIYISHIIFQMLLDGVRFTASEVSEFLDWGTLEDWNKYRTRFCTLFVDLDGVLVERSARYFEPLWGETEAIQANVDVINRLYDTGKIEIIITTARSIELKEVTDKQLERIGLKYHRILYDLFHSRRIIINDYSANNPYRSCDAINLKANSDDLASMLVGL